MALVHGNGAVLHFFASREYLADVAEHLRPKLGVKNVFTLCLLLWLVPVEEGVVGRLEFEAPTPHRHLL